MDYAAPDIDLRLIERFTGGEEAAFDALVARHRRVIYNLVYHMVGDREAAEDVTLEVFLQAYLSLRTFRRRAKFSTWLHRIAVNVCLQHLRQPRLRRQAAEVRLGEEHVLTSEDAIEPVLRREAAALVVAAMQELPETQRAAVILYHLQDRDFSEISEILGIPAGTAKTRIFHGTRMLRDKLRALGILPSSRRGNT
jgi:RNA polymerase sigma-70 factor (ECF subfamily)